MNNINKIAVAAALFCSAASTTALAQTADYNPSWYIAPSLNVMDPDNRFGLTNHGEGVGLRAGKPLSEYWDIQFGTTYARARQTPNRYQQNTFGADGLFMLSRGMFRPFLLAGLGEEHDKLNVPLGETSKSSPYINAGLGAQFSLNDQWALQADFRRVHGFLRNNAFSFDRSNNNYLTIGLNYSFDAPPAPVVARAAPAPEPAPVAAPEPTPPAPPPPPPPPAPKFEKYTLSSTELFGFDSAVLNTPQPKLDEIAAALKNDPSVTNVIVTGYTDRLGSKTYNMKLSKKRADAVKDYLVGKGVAPARLAATGKGAADPVVQCHNKKRADLIKCLEPNRRVEVERITVERRVK